MNRDLPLGLREFARKAARDGWRWERTRGDHIRFWHPDTAQTVIAAGTSGDINRERILRRQMRRALEAPK